MNPDIDIDNLEITFTAASGEPYLRYDEETEQPYFERLILTAEAVDLERLNGGASILKNHDPDGEKKQLFANFLLGNGLALHKFF